MTVAVSPRVRTVKVMDTESTFVTLINAARERYQSQANRSKRSDHPDDGNWTGTPSPVWVTVRAVLPAADVDPAQADVG